MAYAALVSLAQTISLFLNRHQNLISHQVKNQIICMKEYAILLREFLENFPEEANGFEGRIREVTHEAEDKIELIALEKIHKSNMLRENIAGQKSLYGRIFEERTTAATSSNGSKLRYQPKEQNVRIGDECELKRITKEIESLAEKVMEIKNSIVVKDVRLGDSTVAGSSSSFALIHKHAMVGFDNDLMEIKSRLCRESSKLQIVPIVGMGGMGKTTLATNVYDDPLIIEHFQIRVWVTLSQNYSVKEIVAGLLISMKVLEAKSEPMREEHVYQNLKGRRYLIVLDDIWSIKAWDDLKMMFPDDSNGSRILLSTRLSDVASYPDSYSRVHEMHLMDEDQSWNLLRQKVFKKEACPLELEDIGKMISSSCRGLPLAIVVISGILFAADQTETAWKTIADNVKSAISASDDQCDKILSLSYTHLPHYLRPCFLYMGGFPEDYQMRVSKLIKLWVAEGFLKQSGSKSFEETAEEYLEDLVKRSLVLVTERKSNGRIKRFNIHDLMREMCIRIAQEENFFQNDHMFHRHGIKIRRISTTHSDLDFLTNVRGSTIRTIIHLNPGRFDPQYSLEYFGMLRILDLSNAYAPHKLHGLFPSLPTQLFKLFHLRYLALDFPIEIPAAISNLENLQTLIICFSKQAYYVSSYMSLPVEIWRMPQLRHLVFCFGVRLSQIEAKFDLPNLQTLSGVINFICSEKILKRIPNLKKLGISYRTCMDDDGKFVEDYELHNLIYLQQLENLKLEVSLPYREKVKLAFPRTLKKLTLSGVRLPWKDMIAVGSLPNLEVLKLRNHDCDDITWETTEGEFQELKVLLVDQSNLKHWITERSHFPRLKWLVLHRCWYLSEIPEDIGEIPTLELIEVDNWNRSLLNSAKQIQDIQQSYGNDALQFRFVKDYRVIADDDSE